MYYPGILSGGGLFPGTTAASVRNTLGLGTADSPTFTGLELGTNQNVRWNASNNSRITSPSSGTVDIYSAGFITRFSSGSIGAAGSIGIGTDGNNPLVRLYHNGSNNLQQRNGTNPQQLEIDGTWTSESSKEFVKLRGKSGANFELAVGSGSLGGTARGLIIGGLPAGTDTIVPWQTIDASASTFTGDVILSGTSKGFRLNPGGTSRGLIYFSAAQNRLYSTGAVPWVVESDSGFIVRNAANSADAPITASDITTVGASSTSRIFQSGGVGVLANQVANIAQWVSGEFNSYGRIGIRIATFPTYIDADAANSAAFRNGTAGQSVGIYKSYTSSTNYECLRLNAAAINGATPVHRIESAKGTGGGTVRAIEIGGNDGTTFTPWLTLGATGIIKFIGNEAGTSYIETVVGNTPYLRARQSTGVVTKLSPFGIDSASSSGTTDVGIARIAIGTYGINTDGVSTGTAWRDLWLRDIVLLPSESRTLSTNGQFTFERVSNTEINLVYRGDDGTTRRLALPGFA